MPRHRNQGALLDTPQVRDLVEYEEAVFVDPRHPGEFAAGHLPGAVNLPLQSTPTAALKRTLSDLPKRPIIVPCYDRRSCAFGEVLGGSDFTIMAKQRIKTVQKDIFAQLDEVGF